MLTNPGLSPTANSVPEVFFLRQAALFYRPLLLLHTLLLPAIVLYPAMYWAKIAAFVVIGASAGYHYRAAKLVRGLRVLELVGDECDLHWRRGEHVSRRLSYTYLSRWLIVLHFSGWQAGIGSLALLPQSFATPADFRRCYLLLRHGPPRR